MADSAAHEVVDTSVAKAVVALLRNRVTLLGNGRHLFALAQTSNACDGRLVSWSGDDLEEPLAATQVDVKAAYGTVTASGGSSASRD